MFQDFFKKKAPKIQTKSLYLGLVGTAKKEILERIVSEHPNTLSLELVPDKGYPSPEWRATLLAPINSPEKLEWAQFLYLKGVEALKANQEALTKSVFAATAQHPNEKPYEGMDPLLKWRPLVEPKAIAKDPLPVPRAQGLIAPSLRLRLEEGF